MGAIVGVWGGRGGREGKGRILLNWIERNGKKEKGKEEEREKGKKGGKEKGEGKYLHSSST